MNKELIKKYKIEFDHYIDGGSIIARIVTSDEDDFCYTVWYEVDALALDNWKADYLFNLTDKQIAFYKPQFIINDKYVELRKALLENKTIQILDVINQTHIGLGFEYEWRDSKSLISSSSFSKPLDKYRIKPEPTIKVDDWLFNLQYKTYHRVNKVLSDKVELNEFNVLLSAIDNHNYKLWKPQLNEWCIIDSEPATDHYYFTVQKWEENAKWTPIPYTGPIPYFIKD